MWAGRTNTPGHPNCRSGGSETVDLDQVLGTNVPLGQGLENVFPLVTLHLNDGTQLGVLDDGSVGVVRLCGPCHERITDSDRMRQGAKKKSHEGAMR